MIDDQKSVLKVWRSLGVRAWGRGGGGPISQNIVGAPILLFPMVREPVALGKEGGDFLRRAELARSTALLALGALRSGTALSSAQL